MWIFTKHGFISVVKHLEREGCLLVRARRREDLEGILDAVIEKGFPIEDITETPEADYRFRVVVPRGWFREIADELISGIDYPNFKDSIPKEKPGYHHYCNRVWYEMMQYQLTDEDNLGNGNPHINLS